MKKIILLVIIFLAFPVVIFANGNDGDCWGSSFNHMMSFGFTPIGWFGGFFMILFWAAIIFAIVVVVKQVSVQNKKEKKSKSALDILKERYAKGEIDKEEFDERKKHLSS